MSTIDGNDVERILWSEGFDFSTHTDEDDERTILKIAGTNVDIGLVWPDEESESGWSLEVGDIYLYHEGTYYTSLTSEDAQGLVEEVMEALGELGG